MALFIRNFRKFLRRENQKVKNSERGRSTDRRQASRCFKSDKTDHVIKDCPQWEIKWKNRRVEKEKEEASKNKETIKAMSEESRVKTEKENQLLKEQVAQLGSSNLGLQSEVLKLTLRSGMHDTNNDQLEAESGLKSVRRKLQLERDKSKDISSKLLKTENKLKRENRWT
ncbi:uncharacterized protein LOC132630536 [Lycium barbarum]|uniref:uncharacterized protein LOC132630536 n=1 Tax=Lycium barbarum TaxID=112863 RepID=UPI00293F3314|nr:uncharacterized protein LOC132630536 [Lycium barbarum]